MLSYLKRAREHKEFLLKETKEFERGKRHLANMMGIESQEMTQDDIDDAVKYLFPSGLFDCRARPMMKHPDFLFKAQKDAQFDTEGRPHHHLFYTIKPNYHEALSQVNQHMRELNKFEDEQLAKGILDPPEDSRFEFSGRAWLGQREMCDKFIEKIAEHEHEYFTKCLDQLTMHPYSSKVGDFIKSLSRELQGQSFNLDLPELTRDEETGQIYTEIVSKKREHKVLVKTVLNGSGKLDIDGHDILYFDAPYFRRAILFPLQISNMIDKVDIFAKVVVQPKTFGQGAIAMAIRSAVSRSIAAYVDSETREQMRLAGLLAPDVRLKERKKFGQEGARRKYTWKKR